MVFNICLLSRHFILFITAMCSFAVIIMLSVRFVHLPFLKEVIPKCLCLVEKGKSVITNVIWGEPILHLFVKKDPFLERECYKPSFWPCVIFARSASIDLPISFKIFEVLLIDIPSANKFVWFSSSSTISLIKIRKRIDLKTEL